MKNIGLIGAGTMGEPMGVALLRAGFALRVCAHRSREAVERLVAQGATEKADPAGVGAACDALILMVPDAPQAEEALFGSRGAAASLRPGSYVIIMATIAPAAARSLHGRLAQRQIALLDAPVSGGPARAATADLAIMVGAEDDAYAECQAVLSALGHPIHVGGPGLGETVKLANQIIISSVMLADVEALVFAKKAGADIEKLRGVIANATGANYVLDRWLPQFWFNGGEHEGGFALDLLRKDLRAAIEAAQGMNVPMAVSKAALSRFDGASAQGLGSKDYSAVAQPYERAAGVKVV
ncbi:MAG: NAD(P)-dependent oxidoreductase [Candidatus Eremiobacteraeota bacterium]|nr:NAD(P)-dependent oxidoreductase [Candidatus Eremiobacteraeota bacterium]MBC5828466.1 NAD(P)-dependent oxidoreductase [Candidatus Eremiobacteraeota bacterium]